MFGKGKFKGKGKDTGQTPKNSTKDDKRVQPNKPAPKELPKKDVKFTGGETLKDVQEKWRPAVEKGATKAMNENTDIHSFQFKGTEPHLSTNDKNCSNHIISMTAQDSNGEPITNYHVNLEAMISSRKNNGEFSEFH